MKVLHFIDSGGLYGAEKVLLTLVKEQLKQGLEPMILSAGALGIDEKPIEAEARRQGLPIKLWRMRPGLNFGETKKIVAWAARESFDIFHSHGYKFNILLGLFPRRKLGAKLVTTLHGYVHAKRFSKMWLYEAMDRLALKRMNAIFLVSETMLSDIPASGRGDAPLVVIPNGLDVDELEVRTNVALRSDMQSFTETHNPLVVAIGRLSHEKGFDLLLEAFALVRKEQPTAGLLILGEGALRGALEAQAALLGLEEALAMPGYCNEIPACLRCADLMVMPSRTEGLPITLLEAMAIGTPVVASRVGGIPNALGMGQGGKLLSALSADDLRVAILGTLSGGEEKYSRIEWARDKVRSCFSGTAMAERYRTQYRQVLALT